MTTNSPTVPSRFVCPITKAYSPDKPFEAHMFISHRLQPELKMHLEWAWGLNPHQLVIKNVQNCIGYRRDIIRNSLNGDFALVPTMTTLNTMLAYFSLPCDTPRVYHTRTLGVEFIKHRRITFKDYMPEAAFRYFFVPITPAGEAICDEFLMGEDSEQVEDDYEGAVEPVSGDDVDPETLKQFRVVTSHVHPFFVALIAHGLLFPIRTRPGRFRRHATGSRTFVQTLLTIPRPGFGGGIRVSSSGRTTRMMIGWMWTQRTKKEGSFDG